MRLTRIAVAAVLVISGITIFADEVGKPADGAAAGAADLSARFADGERPKVARNQTRPWEVRANCDPLGPCEPDYVYGACNCRRECRPMETGCQLASDEWACKAQEYGGGCDSCTKDCGV